MTEKEEPMSVDEEESSDSSSSSDDDDQEKVLLSKAEDLERQISANKYLYDAHVKIVDLYSQIGDLNSMREAYRRFQECFPLTPKLWLQWIRTEIKIASTPAEQKRVFELFDQAVEDYLSIELWIEYAQYSIGASDLQTTRSILERGLTAGGLHVSEGSLLWDTLRELENAHVCTHQEGSEEWKAQIVRLAEVFKRQLSVPLLGMENTYQEWQEWVGTLPDGIVDTKSFEWAYKKALELLNTYKPFEDKLLAVDSSELYDVYKEYVKLVKDPSAVLCLYERAAVSLCLTPDLWQDYCMYAFKLGDAATKISSRALKNCPWSEELWITRLRILEHQNKPEKEVLACFELGLSSISSSTGLELWLCYLGYMRRNSNDVVKLDKLFTQAIQQVGAEKSDPSYKLNRWHARLLARRGDMVTARKIWNAILSQKLNKGSSILWLEYANLERQYGEPTQLRIIFKRALSANTDWPQCISEEWLMYEREFGTLEDELKCAEKIKTVTKAHPPISTQITELPQQSNASFDQERKKRKFEHQEKRSDSKKGKFGNRPDPRREKPEAPPVVARTYIDKNPKTTVFVSNLYPGVNEDMLRELFPNASLIEIVKDRKGKSRCYGYIQFSKEEEVMTALARDRVPLDGRPVFISEIKPEKTERKPVFKYATSTEANKLFVRGLPVTKSKEEVEEIFKPYKPTDVRIVMRKSGESKGIAYVEFENEAAAREAIKATDQMKVDDQVISVAISAPPPKKASNPVQNEPIRHARSRLQLPLIPRSLQIKTNEEKSEKSETNMKKALKTNADFRNMLLKK